VDGERDYVVSLALVPGIGARRLETLLEQLDSARAAWEAPEDELVGAGLPRPVAASLVDLRDSSPDRLPARALAERGLRAVTYLDENYPPDLRLVADRPPVLYVRGDPRCLGRPAVAVVGTRRPTPYGRETAARLAGDLAAAGCVVVSGLAVGIDTAAHRGALDAGGETAAVLGSGLDHIYPHESRPLADEIAERGVIVSQFRPDTMPRKGTFPARNGVVVGLSRGVVVVEAPLESGALDTACRALALGRPLMAVPGPVTTSSFEGCHRLLRGPARLVTGGGEVLEEIGLKDIPGADRNTRDAAGYPGGRRPGPGARRGASSPDRLTGPAAEVLVRPVAQGCHGDAADRPTDPAAEVLEVMLPGEQVPFALLMARTGLAADRLGTFLGLLELQGLVERRPGENYIRT